jgi:hypothetical protein
MLEWLTRRCLECYTSSEELSDVCIQAVNVTLITMHHQPCFDRCHVCEATLGIITIGVTNCLLGTLQDRTRAPDDVVFKSRKRFSSEFTHHGGFTCGHVHRHSRENADAFGRCVERCAQEMISSNCIFTFLVLYNAKKH